MNLSRNTLFSLDGRTVVLTGASGFLGRTFAEALLVNGANLVAIGRASSLTGTCSAWARSFGKDRVYPYYVDMFDLEALRRVLDQIAQTHEVDVLINNAHELTSASGFNIPSGGLEGASLEHWTRNVTAGVYWPFMAIQALGEGMKRRGRGSIINVSTMYAVVAPRPQLYSKTKFMNPPAYSASKAALLSFTRYVASFWGPYGIRANAILPGPFSNTAEDGPNSVDVGDEFIEKLKRNTCLGRIGRPEELIGALLLLSSDASSFLTGQAIVVDGGWTSV